MDAICLPGVIKMKKKQRIMGKKSGYKTQWQNQSVDALIKCQAAILTGRNK